jgi:hypothetical protein
MDNNKSIVFGFLSIFIAFIAQPVLHAEVRLQSASLLQGSSIARFSNAPAWLHWAVDNPDPAEATVVLQLEPDTGSSGAIYSARIRIGAKSRLEGRSQVTIGDSERYIVSLIKQNLRVDKTDILVRPTHRNRLNIAVLTDDENFPGTGEISKNEVLYRRLQFSNIRHKNVPYHVNGFAIFDLLILHNPDLPRYSLQQKRAVLDYVRNGGVIVVSGAETAFSLLNSELEELLPYYPLASLHYEGLTGIRQSFSLPPAKLTLRDENGDLLPQFQQTFLEVLTPLESTVLVRQAERPLVCVAQAGLGHLIGLCFDPFLVCKADSELLTPIWDTLIRYSNYLPQSMQPDQVARTNEILQHLQGYVIPSVSEIFRIFMLYVLVAILILAVAFHFKRPALGWCVLCLGGFFYTLFIFQQAGKIAVNQPEQSFTSVSASIWDGNMGPQHGTGNLFSKSDCRPSISADLNSFFFMPQERSLMHEGGTALAPTILHVVADEQKTGTEKISLQQYRPRTLRWARASVNHGLDRAELPQLTFTANGLELQDWQIPRHLQNARRALLVLPNAILPLQLLDGEIAGIPRRFEGMETDLVFLSTVEYIRSLRLPNPAICVISAKISAKCEMLNIDNGGNPFSGYDWHLEFIPLKIAAANEFFSLDSGFITIDIPPRSILRQYFKHGEFSDIMIQAGISQALFLDFNIYHVFHGFQADEIKVVLDISNPSGRATFDLSLIDLTGRDIEPSRREGNTFIFRPESPVIDRHENKIRAVLRHSGKAEDNNNVSQRINSWKILSCEVQIAKKS